MPSTPSGTAISSCSTTTLILSLIAFKGDTVFRPPDYEFRLTPVFNFNHTEVEELRVLNIDPREGETRDRRPCRRAGSLRRLPPPQRLGPLRFRLRPRRHPAVLRPISAASCSTTSSSASACSATATTTAASTTSPRSGGWRRTPTAGSTTSPTSPRDDCRVIANLYRQDFPFLGLTSQVTLTYNRNREGDEI